MRVKPTWSPPKPSRKEIWDLLSSTSTLKHPQDDRPPPLADDWLPAQLSKGGGDGAYVMDELPAPVWAYLGSHLIATRSPAYLTLDLEHRLMDWGGEITIYGLVNLQRGERVGDQVMMLQDVLPLEDEPLVLRWIEMQPRCYVDIHLFTSETTIWVLFLNSTVEATQYMQMQQRINEAELYRDCCRNKDESRCGEDD